MKKIRRREFLGKGKNIAVAAGIMSMPVINQENDKKEMKETFLHHVFFWLKDPNDQNTAVFEKALRDLVTIDSISRFQLGKPAATRREVIDSTYHYSLLTLFNNKAGHDNYQVHAVHDTFRKVASELCSRILVYDSVPFMIKPEK